MTENKRNYLQDISTKIIDDSLSITTISDFENYYVLSLQMKIEAFDNSGIGHLIEHLIIDKAYEILKEKKDLVSNTHISGATYPNYIIFYIDSCSYTDFCAALDAFLYVFANFGECKYIYNRDRLNRDRTDAISIIAELERRENDRISVIWHNFYSKRFRETEYQFNSGGYSSTIYCRTFEELNDIWESHSLNKVDVVLSVPQFKNEVIDKILKLHDRRKICNKMCSFNTDILPKNNNRYKTNLSNSFSYGIGIVNKVNIGSEFKESLLFNSCAKYEKVRRGVDFLYDNAAVYGMFYFGIHTTKSCDYICSDDLFDMFFQMLNDVNVNYIETVSKVLIERLQLTNLDDNNKCIEIIARIMQRFRRNQLIDETIFKLPGETKLSGKELKDGLTHMLTDFRNDIDNKELLFCFQ